MSDLRGIVLRGDGDALVVQATPDEVRRFMAQTPARGRVDVRGITGTIRFPRAGSGLQPIDLTGPPPEYVEGLPARGRIDLRDGLLYDKAGLPVARIRHLNVSGLGLDVHIEAEGLDGIQLL